MVEREQAKIVIHVQPNANQNKVVGFRDGVLQVRIAASPTKGKANQELVEFLSSFLGVSKSNLSIEKGMTSKKKIVAVEGLRQDWVLRLLEKYQPN